MGFETPLMLVALAALAGPIVAHFSRGRSLPTQPLPTVVLLKRAQAARGQQARLTDRLHLWVRLAAVCCLVVAFAGPYGWAKASTAEGGPVALALVVDDSFSMTQRRDGAPALTWAKAEAQSAIARLPAGSEVVVIAAAAPARIVLHRTSDLELGQQAAGEISQAASGTQVAEALSLARNQLLGASSQTRKVLFLTDSQGVSASQEAALRKTHPGSRLEFKRWDAPRPSNVMIAGAEVTEAPQRDMYLVLTQLKCFGFQAPFAVTVTLTHPDVPETQCQARFTPDSHGEGAASCALEVAAPARPEVMAQLAVQIPAAEARDAIPNDNQWPLALSVKDSLQVWLLDGTPSANFDRSGVGYLTRALDHAPTGGRRIRYQTINEANLIKRRLNQSDVVVLADVARPSEALLRQLTTHVMRGGGVLIAGGPRVVPTHYRAHAETLLPAPLRAAETPPTPLSLRGQPTTADGRGIPLDVGRADGLEAAALTGRVLLGPLHHDTRIVLETEDGAPALLWRPVGNGRVALWTSTLNRRWNNLPFQPGFLPLMVRLLRGLSVAPATGPREVQAGTPFRSNLFVGGLSWDVRHEDGTRQQQAHGLDAFRHTQFAGRYGVTALTPEGTPAEEESFSFWVRPDPAESNLQASPSIGTVSLGGVTTPSAAASHPSQAAWSRRPFHPWLLLAFGALLALEAAFQLRRSRHALEPLFSGLRWLRRRRALGLNR